LNKRRQRGSPSTPSRTAARSPRRPSLWAWWVKTRYRRCWSRSCLTQPVQLASVDWSPGPRGFLVGALHRQSHRPDGRRGQRAASRISSS